MKKVAVGLEGPKRLGVVKDCCIETGVSMQSASLDTIYYQHTVLCQTCMPYRNPGDDVRVWNREQGDVALHIEAGMARQPETKRWIQLGLPFGPKARLILAYLNAEALRTGTPEINVERSLTAFVRRIQDPTRCGKSGPNGPQICVFKDQLMRLSVATIRLVMKTEKYEVQVNSQFVEAFDLWLKQLEDKKSTWVQTICLNPRYFDNLQKHAVPLSERALAALSHSAMALDIYTWLAQRLHRVPYGKPQTITWAAVKGQFGLEYGQMGHFKQKFHIALSQVLAHYQEARIELDRGGLMLKRSPPPVSVRVAVV